MEHNPVPGAGVWFREWTGSEYIEHAAIVRAVIAGGHEHHADLSLTYSDGANAVNVNNVPNIENITSDGDNWRWLIQPQIEGSKPFHADSAPTAGQPKWIMIYENGSHTPRYGFIRAVLAGTPPNLNMTTVDPVTEARVNVNQVVPFSDPGAETGDYWADI